MAYFRLNYKIKMKLIYKIFFLSSPVEKCFIFWREKQSAISETFGNNMRNIKFGDSEHLSPFKFNLKCLNITIKRIIIFNILLFNCSYY